MEAEITLEYACAKIAEVISKAVSPDNVSFSTNLKIRTWSQGNKVLTRIESAQGLSTLIATFDDFLFSVAAAEKVITETLKLKIR